MKNLIYFIAFAFVISCSSDDDAAPELALTDLTARGSVAEQTVAQAKKTIYGKWDIANSGKSYSSAKSNACAFDFIEFTDDAYVMALIVDGYSVVAFGTYSFEPLKERGLRLMVGLGQAMLRYAEKGQKEMNKILSQLFL